MTTTNIKFLTNRLIISIVLLLLLLSACRKKEEKPSETPATVPETPATVPESSEIVGYFIRLDASYDDSRGNPTSHGGGSTIKAFFKNGDDWLRSAKANTVKVNDYVLSYLDNPEQNEDWFSGNGIMLTGDTFSYPKQYYYLPTSVFTSTFVYPYQNSIWSVSGLNGVSAFNYTDTLGKVDLFSFQSPPNGIIYKSKGFQLLYTTTRQITALLEVRDESGPLANKNTITVTLQPKNKKENVFISTPHGDSAATWNVYYPDTLKISSAILAKLTTGKNDACIIVRGEKCGVTQRISGKNFRFSRQFEHRLVVDIKD